MNYKPVRVLLADPAWQFNDRKATRKDNPAGKPKFGLGVARRYGMGVQQTSDIEALGTLIKSVIAPDCYCFMWCTCSHLPDAIKVLEAWGFKYRTVAFAWVKTTSKSGEWFKGPGSYVPGNLEIVLLGRPKKCKLWHTNKGTKPFQIVCAPQERDLNAKGHPIIHSRKPADVHERIESWLGHQIGDHAMLELYAREKRPGWVCLGGDVTGRDLAQDLADYACRLVL